MRNGKFPSQGCWIHLILIIAVEDCEDRNISVKGLHVPRPLMRCDAQCISLGHCCAFHPSFEKSSQTAVGIILIERPGVTEIRHPWQMVTPFKFSRNQMGRVRQRTAQNCIVRPSLQKPICLGQGSRHPSLVPIGKGSYFTNQINQFANIFSSSALRIIKCNLKPSLTEVAIRIYRVFYPRNPASISGLDNIIFRIRHPRKAGGKKSWFPAEFW